MKTMKLTSRSKQSGEGLVVIIVLVLILVGIWWYLQSTKTATQREGVRYGHDVIDRLVIKHDRSILDQDLDPQAKIEMPPSQRDYLIQRFTQLGVPGQPIPIEDNISFDSYFFHAHGVFTAQLNYPGQPVTLQIATSQGDTKWLINNITISMGTMPH
jgi:hypothetical protein